MYFQPIIFFTWLGLFNVRLQLIVGNFRAHSFTS